MATMPRGEPRSVPDPAGDACDESMRREAELRRRRENEEARPRSVAKTAQTSGRMLTAFEAVPKAIGQYAKDPAAARASRFVGKVARPVSPVTAWVAADAGYTADRAAGISKDEAMLRNYGGLALGYGLGAVGAVAGTELSPGFGTLAGGYAGMEAGGWLADKAADGLHGFRSWKEDVQNGVYGSVNDPHTWTGILR